MYFFCNIHTDKFFFNIVSLTDCISFFQVSILGLSKLDFSKGLDFCYYVLLVLA